MTCSGTELLRTAVRGVGIKTIREGALGEVQRPQSVSVLVLKP